jgi:hypothetical protein
MHVRNEIKNKIEVRSGEHVSINEWRDLLGLVDFYAKEYLPYRILKR